MIEGIFSISFQWIDIKESVPLQINCSEHIIKKGNFGHIQIFCIFVCQKHSKVEENIAYSGTGLIECVSIGKKKFWTKPLNTMNSSETTGYVHSGISNISPNSVKCLGV